MSAFNLQNFLSNLTNQPGIYQMLNEQGEVLYVGKAGNLKKRLLSYFNKNISGIKTQSLVKQIADIKVTVTRSETEALLLESTLIKQLYPKYNVLMRDDKTYPYIHISKHEFPRIELFRSKKKPQKGEFFGPYPNVSSVRETINTIAKIFKIRTCKDSYFNTRSRPCLQYQIKRCSAPCTNYINNKEYQEATRNAVKFLQGKNQFILEELSKKMDEAIAELAFEKAALIRDQIKHLRLIQESQGVVQLQGDADIIAIEAKPGFASIQCSHVRNGHILAGRSFFPKVPIISLKQEILEKNKEGEVTSSKDLNNIWGLEVFNAFIHFYYLHNQERIPAHLVTNIILEDKQSLERVLSELRNKSCKIHINPHGYKGRWLDFALNNLQLAISDHVGSASLIKLRYQELAKSLNILPPIHHMECFDVSHTQGESPIASCVVFDANGPVKKEYRRFNIANITKGDDYAALKQALQRRLKKLTEENNLPQVLIVDGGKGQVAVASKVLIELNLASIFLIGIAKGPSRKAGQERLILTTQTQEVCLPENSLALHLLQHIRDEAHRFAINAHRKKRTAQGFKSSLESLEGVGPKRRQALLRRFGGMQELEKAPLAEIAKVPGISSALALKIFTYLNNSTRA